MKHTPTSGPLCQDWVARGLARIWHGCVHTSCWAIVAGTVPLEYGLLPAYERLKEKAARCPR